MSEERNPFVPPVQKVVAIVKIETAITPNESQEITKALAGNVPTNPISPQNIEIICQIIAEEIDKLISPDQELDAIIIVRPLPKKTAATK